MARMSSMADKPPETTRKQRREQARAQRRATEEARTAQEAQRNRLYQLTGAAFVVVVLIAIVLLVTGSNGSKKAPSPTSPAASKEAREVVSLLHGIAQTGNTLGSPSAPLTMQYFGDLECPICREFTLGALPTLIQKYVRTGKMKIEYRSLETATRNPETFQTQQAAALAAGKQNKMWYFVELFYHEQGEEDSGYVTENYLQGLAQQVPGLNLADWSTARTDRSYLQQITNDGRAAAQHGFSGTPSFLLGRTGGKLNAPSYASLTDPSSFEAAIEEALKA
jgi:protein-disulfide isomerase